MIMTGVGNLMQRIRDGRTGQIFDGRTIERSDDVVCGLHHTLENKEHKILG
jgi:hypothetical protein